MKPLGILLLCLFTTNPVLSSTYTCDLTGGSLKLDSNTQSNLQISDCTGSTVSQDGTFTLGDCATEAEPNYKEAVISYSKKVTIGGKSVFMGSKRVPLECGFKTHYKIATSFDNVVSPVSTLESTNEAELGFTMFNEDNIGDDYKLLTGQPVTMTVALKEDATLDPTYVWAPIFCRMIDPNTQLNVEIFNVETENFDNDVIKLKIKYDDIEDFWYITFNVFSFSQTETDMLFECTIEVCPGDDSESNCDAAQIKYAEAPKVQGAAYRSVIPYGP